MHDCVKIVLFICGIVAICYFIKIMGSPKDITHCFAFDKVQKPQNLPRVQRVRNGFLYGTYLLLSLLIAIQFYFLFII
jgi:hypothetical protein